MCRKAGDSPKQSDSRWGYLCRAWGGVLSRFWDRGSRQKVNSKNLGNAMGLPLVLE